MVGISFISSDPITALRIPGGYHLLHPQSSFSFFFWFFFKTRAPTPSSAPQEASGRPHPPPPSADSVTAGTKLVQLFCQSKHEQHSAQRDFCSILIKTEFLDVTFGGKLLDVFLRFGTFPA